MKFTWAVLPQYYNKELVLRPFLHLSEKNSVEGFAGADPYARLDNFFVIFGMLLLSETSALFRRYLSCKPLVSLGRRSLSALLLPCTLCYQLTTIFRHLHRAEYRLLDCRYQAVHASPSSARGCSTYGQASSLRGRDDHHWSWGGSGLSSHRSTESVDCKRDILVACSLALESPDVDGTSPFRRLVVLQEIGIGGWRLGD